MWTDRAVSFFLQEYTGVLICSRRCVVLMPESVMSPFLNTLDQPLLVEFGRHGLEDLLGQTVLELRD